MTNPETGFVIHARISDKTQKHLSLHGLRRRLGASPADALRGSRPGGSRQHERQRRLREIAYELRREERRRLNAQTLIEELPSSLRLADEQIADWERRWSKATRGAPIEFDEAQAVAVRFIDPVLRDSVAGQRWRATEQRWS